MLAVEDFEFLWNNWRGAWGRFYGWAVAGIKSMHIHDGIYLRHKSVGNQTPGVLTGNSENLTLENNVIYGNGGSKILVTGDFNRPVTDWEIGEKMMLKAQHWTLKDNVIVGRIQANPFSTT